MYPVLRVQLLDQVEPGQLIHLALQKPQPAAELAINQMHNRSGFTLIEIIVATVLFALIIVGIVGVFVGGKRQIMHARERVTSAELGKFFIDPMQSSVRQSDWDQAANALKAGTTYCDSVGGHTQNSACPLSAQRTVNNTEFSSKHEIDNVSGTALRRVKTTISWNEI